MNLLIITNWFYPDTLGGSDRVIYEISKGLSLKGHYVCVVTSNHGRNLPYYEKYENLDIYRYHTPSEISNKNKGIKDAILFYLKGTLNCRNLLNEIAQNKKFDIVHLNHLISSLGFNLSSHFKNTPIVHSFYSAYNLEYEDKVVHKNQKDGIKKIKFHQTIISSLLKSIESFNINRANKIVVLSEYSKSDLQKIHKVKDEKISIIPGGVDTDKFKPISTNDDRNKEKINLRKILSLPEDKFLILTVRRLVERMGLENLICAMKDVNRHYPFTYLIIGGEGILMEALHQLIIKENLNNCVKLVGFIPDNKLPFYYQTADLFVLPTRSLEGFGIATIESLSSGLPVIGTNVGATPEILNPLSPNLVISDSLAETIANSIIKFIELSEKEKESLREKCREYVLQNYSAKIMVERIENLYTSLIGK